MVAAHADGGWFMRIYPTAPLGPSETVFGVVFLSLNSFSEGIWSTRAKHLANKGSTLGWRSLAESLGWRMLKVTLFKKIYPTILGYITAKTCGSSQQTKLDVIGVYSIWHVPFWEKRRFVASIIAYKKKRLSSWGAPGALPAGLCGFLHLFLPFSGRGLWLLRSNVSRCQQYVGSKTTNL